MTKRDTIRGAGTAGVAAVLFVGWAWKNWDLLGLGALFILGTLITTLMTACN